MPGASTKNFNMRILISGANGFVGRAAVLAFQNAGWQVRVMIRHPVSFTGDVETVVTDFASVTDWASVFADVDCVLHLASVVHMAGVPDAVYRAVNVDLTKLLASKAKAAGVKRFIFLSSISVNGAGGAKLVFDEDSRPAPESMYARSKLEAEQALMAIASDSAMSWVIIRPPMVYGFAAPGNFRRLVSICRRGWPLPLAAATAPRSYIGLDNLVSALVCVASHSHAGNRLYLVSDDEDIGTSKLIALISNALGKPNRTWWLPKWFIYFMAVTLGRRNDADRLFCALQVCSRRIQDELTWKPPVNVAEGIRRAVSGFPDDRDR